MIILPETGRRGDYSDVSALQLSTELDWPLFEDTYVEWMTSKLYAASHRPFRINEKPAKRLQPTFKLQRWDPALGIRGTCYQPLRISVD